MNKIILISLTLFLGCSQVENIEQTRNLLSGGFVVTHKAVIPGSTTTVYQSIRIGNSTVLMPITRHTPTKYMIYGYPINANNQSLSFQGEMDAWEALPLDTVVHLNYPDEWKRKGGIR